jgi:hypothetical protein
MNSADMDRRALLLYQLHKLEEQRGDAVPLEDLAGRPEAFNATYYAYRQLEDCFLVAFENRTSKEEPWGNRHQYVSLTDRGRAALLHHIEAVATETALGTEAVEGVESGEKG